MAYAEETQVSVARTREEIVAMLERAGCDATIIGFDNETQTAAVQFRGWERMICFRVTMPAFKDFATTPSGRWSRSQKEQHKRWMQGCRSRWRGLMLCIKAKIEAVESGIETVDEAFLAQIMLPDGSTVGTRMLPAVEQAYLDGRMPAMPRLISDGG